MLSSTLKERANVHIFSDSMIYRYMWIVHIVAHKSVPQATLPRAIDLHRGLGSSVCQDFFSSSSLSPSKCSEPYSYHEHRNNNSPLSSIVSCDLARKPGSQPPILLYRSISSGRGNRSNPVSSATQNRHWMQRCTTFLALDHTKHALDCMASSWLQACRLYGSLPKPRAKRRICAFPWHAPSRLCATYDPLNWARYSDSTL